VAETLAPGTQVQTVNGRLGVVVSVEGRSVEVVFPDGAETLDVDDLVRAADGPVQLLERNAPLGDATAFALRLQALYLRHAYRFDLRSGLSNARIEPNLHQVYIAHLVTEKLQPRMILADEVGLGKTIEAALILKELRARGLVDRVLIVVPASLQYQWQQELRSKFNEDFTVVDSAAAKYLKQGGANPFSKRDSIICSLPFATKRGDEIIEAGWDLVIFDEAHRVRRSLQGANKTNATQAYRMADELKELTDGLLLLTATPMQLHPFELYSLIELVEPGVYPTYGQYELRRKQLPVLNDLMRSLKGWPTLGANEKEVVLDRHEKLLADVLGAHPSVDMLDDAARREQLMDGLVERHPLAGMMVRNRKAELGGFAEREAKRVLVELEDTALQLYVDVTEYIRLGYDRAVANKQLAVGFLMVTYQKMLASSSHAIRESFKRRIRRLTDELEGRPTKKKSKGKSRDEVIAEGRDPDDLSLIADELLELAEAPNKELLQAEIVELELLVERLGDAVDAKAEALVDAVEAILEHDPKQKVVIFTQFRDTQDYLRRNLEAHIRVVGRPVKVAPFNGSMDAETKEDAIKHFRGDASVLISTEAGGEGRNLQFSHILVNYDLPWNPMKVEQRIGRLDRIGQKNKVLIYNLACRDTVEERVLDVLEHRIQLFTESVGSLDPILGEVEDDLRALLMHDLEDAKDRYEAFAEDLEKKTREAREQERVLADFVLDRASLRRDRANELLGESPMASGKDLEHFATEMLSYYGGTVMPHVDGGHVATLSPQLRTKLGLPDAQLRGVFDHQEALVREDLDFFAMGHKLMDSLVSLGASADSTTAARVVLGVPAGVFVEAWYELQADGPVVLGRVVRHLVGAELAVETEHVRELPAIGREISVPQPEWAADALAASRASFRAEQDELRSQLVVLLEERKAEERARAERIFEYREKRLRHRIDEANEWLANAEQSTNEKLKRVMPARRGKRDKDVERLDHLRADYERDLAAIDRQQAVVSGRVWAAGLVVGE
jgi:superfamily II DNA or RNA helicase